MMDSSEPLVRASHVDQATFNALGTGQYINMGSSTQSVNHNSGSGTMTNIGSIVGGAVFNSVNILPSQAPFTGSYAHSSLHPVASYVTRPDLEQQLVNELQSPSNTNSRQEMRTAVVWGLGGVGKSQLVLNYVREHQQQYQAVFRIQAGQRETIERDYFQIYKQLYPSTRDDHTTASVDHAIVSVKSWLQRQDKRCLWVMDSADDVEDDNSGNYVGLHHYLPSVSQLDRIVTTRYSTAQGFSSQDAIEVKEMAEEEAVALFRRCSGASVQGEHNEHNVREVVKELGCLALAVTLAGSYVREDPDMAADLDVYLAALRQRRIEILKQKPHRLVHQYGESLLSTWEISYTMVQRHSPIAARLLNVLAFLHFDDIFPDLLVERSNPPDRHEADNNKHDNRADRSRVGDRLHRLFQERQRSTHVHGGNHVPPRARWVQLISSGASETAVTSDTIRTAMKTLQRYSLISWQHDHHACGTHKLVHSWSHDRLLVEERQTWSLAVLELLASLVEDSEGDLSTTQRLVPHVMANFAATSAACGLTYLTTAQDRNSLVTIASLLDRLGRWNDKHEIQQYLFEVTQLAMGAEDHDTLASMNNLALVLNKQGEDEQEEAMALLREAVKLTQKALGPQHPDTLMSMKNLVSLLKHRGEHEEAQQLKQDILALEK